MRNRIEEAQQQLADAVSESHDEVQDARQSLSATKEQIISETQAGRTKADEILDQCADLLVKTRGQTSTMLTDLRAQITAQTEQIENIRHSAIAEGSKTLSELQAELNETRHLTEHSRTDLQRHVQSATGELAEARRSFEDGLSAHRTEITALAENAETVKADIVQRFDKAKQDLDAAAEKHHQHLRQRLLKLVSEADGYASSAEARSGKTIESLQGELISASETADRIHTELRQSVVVLQEKASECRDRYQAEAQCAQSELAQFVEHNRAILEEAEAQVDTISGRADDTARGLAEKIDELRQGAETGAANVGQELEACLEEAEEAAERVERIRRNSEEVAAGLAGRMEQTQTRAETAIHNAEQAVTTIRDQSRASLTEVRVGLEQMNKRAEQLRREMVGIGNQVGETAERGQQQLQQAAADASEQIEARRQAAQDDAEANYRRLDALHQQIEQGAEQIRQNAGRLLEQTQESTASIREHANEMLAQAQGGSDKIGEQATSILMQAHSSAERFREQAETLLERAEATAEAIRADVGTLRSDVLEDSEQLRGQISNVKQEIVDARQESVQAVNDAKCIQEAARKQADQLIRRAGEIESQTEQLLRLPKELVEEANRRATGLADMSKKVSAVVKRLSAVNDDAQRNKSELDQAALTADQKLELLKRHTARVGQLVGIIRQLYGSMDARLERLRNRLSQADDICRGVPQEIENLRQALGEEAEDAPDTVDSKDGSRAEAQVSSMSSSRLQPRPPEPAPDLQETRRTPAGPGTRMNKGSLGEIVQRNQKLNEWLSEVLGEEQVKAASETRAKKPARRKALSKS
jgi:chromosome segregation ATPase